MVMISKSTAVVISFRKYLVHAASQAKLAIEAGMWYWKV
jgi:hypothetical protein